MYKLITGFYPSIKTAQKVLNKVKGNCKSARIEPYDGAFTVILTKSNDYNQIDDDFSKYMKKKIYCGIITIKDNE